MNESIQQLTDKIYREGVEKAELQATVIISDAKRKAVEMVDQAEIKARQIVDAAEKRAEEIQLKTEAEMKLSANHALVHLKQSISNIIIYKLSSESIPSAVQDAEFMQTLISKLIDYWIDHFGREERLQILLPEKEYKNYRNFLEEHTAFLLKTGINTEFSAAFQSGFQIDAIDQGFKVSFTDADFENYFRSFARPRIYKLLFGKES